jgi:diacylglycerol O-acyltransferase / wax synthase
MMARLPGSLVVRVAGAATAGNDLQASNVPGVEEDLYLAGALIERIYPFAPLPGCAAMITLHTYRGMCSVGANLDAAAVKDPELFAQCMIDGFAEVLSLAPTTGKLSLLA